jgi:hypothetical protein
VCVVVPVTRSLRRGEGGKGRGDGRKGVGVSGDENSAW